MGLDRYHNRLAYGVMGKLRRVSCSQGVDSEPTERERILDGGSRKQRAADRSQTVSKGRGPGQASGFVVA